MFNFNKKTSTIMAKKVSCGEDIPIKLLNGDKYCYVSGISPNEFICDKLPKQVMNYGVFDVIVDFLRKNGGKALKGCGRGKYDKIGYGNCTEDTVVYAVATEYYGASDGESTFDPVFVLAAMLEWAGIAKNCRGYIKLI